MTEKGFSQSFASVWVKEYAFPSTESFSKKSMAFYRRNMDDCAAEGESSSRRRRVYHQFRKELHIIKSSLRSDDTRWRVMIYHGFAMDKKKARLSQCFFLRSGYKKDIFAGFGDGFEPSYNINAFCQSKKLPYFFTIHYYLLLPKIDKVI